MVKTHTLRLSILTAICAAGGIGITLANGYGAGNGAIETSHEVAAGGEGFGVRGDHHGGESGVGNGDYGGISGSGDHGGTSGGGHHAPIVATGGTEVGNGVRGGDIGNGSAGGTDMGNGRSGGTDPIGI